MRIGELAERVGMAVDTLRYYEKAGLLPSPPRQGNGYREYNERHVERLAFVRHCRSLDMPLADIQRLLDFVVHPEADCGDINRLIERQLEGVKKRINSLQSLEKQLIRLGAQCERHATARECGILHELVVASHDEGCVCHPDASG